MSDNKHHSNNNNKNIFLFDSGVSENRVIYNPDAFGVDLRDVETIILSHGHFDQFIGLVNVLNRISKPTQVRCHPDGILKR
jgi:7,8-dihydropterin-6-yl-methyl-4-(beta-D-ribofuranosyl)aminobenzene 5'-phosphate synthase